MEFYLNKFRGIHMTVISKKWDESATWRHATLWKTEKSMAHFPSSSKSQHCCHCVHNVLPQKSEIRTTTQEVCPPRVAISSPVLSLTLWNKLPAKSRTTGGKGETNVRSQPQVDHRHTLLDLVQHLSACPRNGWSPVYDRFTCYVSTTNNL